MSWAVAAGACILTVILVGAVRRYALRVALLDYANARSSHVGAVPRGGGLGLVVGFAGSWLFTSRPLAAPTLLAFLGIVVVAAAGWLDDRKGLPVRIRLAAHLLGALSVLPLALPADALPLWIGPLAPVVWIFWTVSAINVVNFVDGIDGIIGIQAVIFGVTCWVLGESGGRAGLFGMLLTATASGFLMWNFPRARIFLGDVGSGTLGLMVVIGGALLLLEGRVSFVAAWLPLYPIFLDASVTLARRLRRGARITEAHREHLYQRLAQRYAHPAVAVAYGVASLSGLAVVVVGGAAAMAVYFGSVAVLGTILDRRVL